MNLKNKYSYFFTRANLYDQEKTRLKIIERPLFIRTLFILAHIINSYMTAHLYFYTGVLGDLNLIKIQNNSYFTHQPSV